MIGFAQRHVLPLLDHANAKMRKAAVVCSAALLEKADLSNNQNRDVVFLVDQILGCLLHVAVGDNGGSPFWS